MNATHDNQIELTDLNQRKIAEYGWALVYCAIVIVTGIFGNTMTVLFYGKRINKTTTNALIAYLATTDLIACMFFIDEIIEICYTINFQSAIGCQLMSFFNHWIVITSGLMLIVVCVDRYRKVCCAHRWQFTQAKTKLAVVGVVLFSCMTAVRNFVILDVVEFNITVPHSDETIVGYYCTHTKDDTLKNVVTAFFVFDILLYSVLMLILLILYAHVAKEIWRVHRLLKQHEILAAKSSEDKKSVSKIEEDGRESVISSTVGDIDVSIDQLSENQNQSRPSEVDNDLTDGLQKERGGSKKSRTLNRSLSRLASKFGTLRSHFHLHHHHHHHRRRHRIERQISLMMIVITIVSVLSYIPYFVVLMTTKRSSNKPEHEFSVGVQIALRSFMLNNAVNPYIMGVFNLKFRQFVKMSLCKICLKEKLNIQ